MITENAIGWSLISIGCLIVVYLLKNLIQRITKSLFSIQQNISDFYSIVQDIQQFTNIDKKLFPFDTRFKIVDNKYLDFGLCVDNLSNQVIECIVDIDKSSFIVNGLTIAKEQLKLYKNNLYPFATHAIWVQVMNTETIPIASEFEISCKMYLNYSAFLQPLNHSITCQFKGTFIINIDDKQNKSIDLIKVIQPASPIS